MTYVVSLPQAYTPVARFDGLPWTQATIGEAASSAGPFTTIQTITLSPVDSDPTRPAARNFTTALATLSSGFYQVTFVDAAGHIQVMPPVQYPGAGTTAVVSPSDVRPTVAEVAALERTRTVATDGTESPGFTTSTTPTAVEVDALIDQAVAAVLNQLPPTPLPKFYLQIRHLVTLYTAVLLEGSYHREHLDQSAVALWHSLFTDGMSALRDAMGAHDGLGPQFGAIVLDSPTKTSYQTAYDPLDWIPPVPA